MAQTGRADLSRHADGWGPAELLHLQRQAFPATDTIHMRVGQKLKVRMIGSNNAFIHPIHIHGGPFQVVARDGMTLAPPHVFWPTPSTSPAGSATLIHCHIGHHTTNNNVETKGGGGLMMLIDVIP